MENGLCAQTLNHPALVLAGLPDSLRMQLGPFNPQIQDVKGLGSLHSLNASAFRLRYANNYPAFPAHLIHHLPHQLFPTVDPRSVPFSAGAFRPFNLSTSPKLFPSAFAPPHKPDSHGLDAVQDLSPGAFVSKIYDNDEDSCYRSPAERDMELSNCDINTKSAEIRGSTPGSPPKNSLQEKPENAGTNPSAESDTSNISNPEDDRGCKRQKLQFDPTCCPICGQMVLLGEAENHFSKEVERLAQLGSLSRERKYLFEKVHPCFGTFGGAYAEENSISSESGLPRGRWETYQRIKSNRLSRLRIKHRRKRNGETPLCPVCNDKLQGSVEDINLHVEHCLKKHSEAEDDEEENIDVEGDSETYGEYDWTGRHLARATTSFLVGGLAAGLLSTATSNIRKLEKEQEEPAGGDGEDAPSQSSDPEVNVDDDVVNDQPTTSVPTDSHFLPKSSVKRSINGK